MAFNPEIRSPGELPGGFFEGQNLELTDTNGEGKRTWKIKSYDERTKMFSLVHIDPQVGRGRAPEAQLSINLDELLDRKRNG
jgi:hypothetical protein